MAKNTRNNVQVIQIQVIPSRYIMEMDRIPAIPVNWKILKLKSLYSSLDAVWFSHWFTLNNCDYRPVWTFSATFRVEQPLSAALREIRISDEDRPTSTRGAGDFPKARSHNKGLFWKPSLVDPDQVGGCTQYQCNILQCSINIITYMYIYIYVIIYIYIYIYIYTYSFTQNICITQL